MKAITYKRLRQAIKILLLSIYFIAPASAQTAIPPASPAPPDASAQRMKLVMRDVRDEPFPETIASGVVVESETASAEVINNRILRLTALDFGETMVIAATATGRKILVVEVVGKPFEQAPAAHLSGQANTRRARAASGSFTVSFAPPSGATPFFLHNTFDYRRRLTDGKILRFDGEISRTFGDSQNLFGLGAAGFGINRLSLGLESDRYTLEFLDTNLHVSPLSFNSYALRGVRLATGEKSALPGAEIFAGLSAYSGSEETAAKIFGVVAPVKSGRNWRVRTGGIFAEYGSPTDDASNLIWHFDALYAADENFSVEGEAALFAGGVNARGRADWQTKNFQMSFEASHIGGKSPLVAAGAQGGGRSLVQANFQWQPTARLTASANFSRAENQPTGRFRRTAIGGSSLLTGISYRLARDAQFSLRYNRQNINTFTAENARFELANQSFSANFSTRIPGDWSAQVEANYLLSRERTASLDMERGIYGSGEVRRAWEKWAMVFFANYNRNTASLTGLVSRNPSLLPTEMRRAYQTNPAQFLAANRNLLTELFAGVALPEARNTEGGVRLQGTTKKLTWLGEASYGRRGDEAVARQNLLLTANVNWRLDAANNLAVNYARAQPVNSLVNNSGGYNALTVSWTHRFGEAGGGFQLAEFLGLNRAKVQGRVFADLDGDGEDDAGEPGVGGVTIKLDNGKIVTTDADGRFRFNRVKPRLLTVALASGELGKSFVASTPTERQIDIAARQRVAVNFGVSNYGFVAGRVYNDIGRKAADGAAAMGNGIGDVVVRLRRLTESKNVEAQAIQTHRTNLGGTYEFPRLSPGEYVLEIDESTLPPDYQLPAQTTWNVKVEPLRGIYVDLPLSANRAVSGVVFVDRDGDEQFDSQKDQAVAGAKVRVGDHESTTDANGAYILRRLPAGLLKIEVRTAPDQPVLTKTIELTQEPTMMRAVNFLMKR